MTRDERQCLLELARQAIASTLAGSKSTRVNLGSLSPRLCKDGATFVTLTVHGELRGCVGALEAYQPLAEDVWEHANAAAFDDFRFPPLTADELAEIRIEISFLTHPVPLKYDGPEDLIARLRPGIDGVLIRDGFRRATFLPQVWEKVPDAEDFLTHLCYKMGASGNLWRRSRLDVYTYQVESFEEAAPGKLKEEEE